ncbi:glycosyltransferase family 4 protein [Oceanibacterium hippocampi]|uniref:Glycosyl transferases group 1 n=1 Tax=Oceanibacterium hippocampi TaxID=745714 RepID=A0A1Y5TEE7_9PROT|nr:glycosyltransferase family 4 protein [Oceanibacterium hippocampi]SLN61858.1 Glycosyl transferases group 1 [Oceanibacterium hippocampi]
MKVCLICVEFFAWGKYGGFGRSARFIGRKLVERGIEVTAVVPQRPGQGPVEEVDGVRVLAYPPNAPWRAAALFRDCDADIYHSQEASLASYLAQHAMPDRRHVITFRDPKFLADWLIELRHPSRSRLKTLAAWMFERNPLVGRAIRHADRLFACAPHGIDALNRRFASVGPIEFLGSPIRIPQRLPTKAEQPTVLFVARWDRRKRPQLFFELAKVFPEVQFIAAGASQDAGWDAALRARYGNLPNLELTGFIDQFETGRLEALFAKAWIFVNTAAREGLPTSFLEAMAHGCALLSFVDPSGVASKFGYHAGEDDFAAGVKTLLTGDAWRARGEAGRDYVSERFEEDRVIDRHLAIYRELLGGP